MYMYTRHFLDNAPMTERFHTCMGKHNYLESHVTKCIDKCIIFKVFQSF